jgi:hypothetical protein
MRSACGGVAVLELVCRRGVVPSNGDAELLRYVCGGWRSLAAGWVWGSWWRDLPVVCVAAWRSPWIRSWRCLGACLPPMSFSGQDPASWSFMLGWSALVKFGSNCFYWPHLRHESEPPFSPLGRSLPLAAAPCGIVLAPAGPGPRGAAGERATAHRFCLWSSNSFIYFGTIFLELPYSISMELSSWVKYMLNLPLSFLLIYFHLLTRFFRVILTWSVMAPLLIWSGTVCYLE